MSKEQKTPEEQKPDAEQVNAVVVHRFRKDDGGIVCVAEILGDVLPTEVETVLALGAKEFKERIGLGQ